MSVKKKTLTLLVFILFVNSSCLFSQTKKLKRPSSRVGISSVDNFVRESFDIYDKVYMYDGYAAANKPLDDSDIDVLENALDDLTILNENAPNIISDIGGESVLKQGKATLQMNRAKKALKYSITTAKDLLKGRNDTDEDTEVSDEDEEEDDEDFSGDEGSQSSQSSTKNSEPSDRTLDLEVMSKFDFVPGDKILFYEDFSNDFVGDFPSRWNTNGSGEIVTFNDGSGNWFELKPGYNTYYIPDHPDLPEDYTIEFDIETKGLDRSTASACTLHIVLTHTDDFTGGKTDWVRIKIPFVQYIDGNIAFSSNRNDGQRINNSANADLRSEVKERPHVSIAVNKERLRLYVNQKKYIDVPKMIAPGAPLTNLKFQFTHARDGEDRVFIKNIKIAEGGVDLRRKLMSEGKISTNGILFDSGSSNIKTQSYGIIKQISQVLLQDKSISLNIIGHTDSDGEDDDNLKLSKERAQAVKEALISVYNIDGARLTVDGKGESEPVADNNSPDGKAQNRRVVFVKT